MEELIKELILNSEESSTTFIGDAIEVGNVVIELMEDGVEFVEDDFESVEDLIEENDILSIGRNVYEDGTIDYFIEKVLTNNGDTLIYGSKVTFIDSDLFDCINIDRIYGDIIVVEAELADEECNGDCEDCYYQEEDEIDEQEMEDILFNELLEEIDELKMDDDLVDNIFDLIRSKIADAYYVGISEGYDNSIYEMQETLDNMKYEE